MGIMQLLTIFNCIHTCIYYIDMEPEDYVNLNNPSKRNKEWSLLPRTADNLQCVDVVVSGVYTQNKLRLYLVLCSALHSTWGADV